MSDQQTSNTRIKIGDQIPEWVMPNVLPERMRTMAAILRDPNPVHWDPASVEALGFGNHTINQGPLGLSYMMNMLHLWQGPRSIRRIIMTFPQVVLDGDHATAHGEVTGLRQENGEHLADCRIWLKVEGRGIALEGRAVVALAG